MSGFGAWVASQVTYAVVLPTDLYDTHDELIGSAGQTLLICDEARPTSGSPAVRRVSNVRDGVGDCKCSGCSGDVDLDDGYCKHCGARFAVTEYEMIGERDG